jgi:hypothetical protein
MLKPQMLSPGAFAYSLFDNERRKVTKHNICKINTRKLKNPNETRMATSNMSTWDQIVHIRAELKGKEYQLLPITAFLPVY